MSGPTTVLLPVLTADTVIDAALSGDGPIVSVPAALVDGGVAVFPRPRIRTDPAGRPVEVALDLTAWLISPPDGRTLLLECPTRAEAVTAAQRWAADVDEHEISPGDQHQRADWCRWWCEQHPTSRLLPGRRWPARDTR